MITQAPGSLLAGGTFAFILLITYYPPPKTMQQHHLWKDHSEVSQLDRGCPPCLWAPPGVKRRPGSDTVHCDLLPQCDIAEAVKHLPGHRHHHDLFSSPLQVPMPAQSKSTLQVGPATGTTSNLFQKSRETCERDVAGSRPDTLPLRIAHYSELCSCLPISALSGSIASPNLTLFVKREMTHERALGNGRLLSRTVIFNQGATRIFNTCNT